MRERRRLMAMPSPSPANLRAFVRRHTRLVAVPDVPDVRLHLADDVTRVWHAAGKELGLADPPLPYWAFAWSGGLAIARYLLDHPDEVAGRRVLDVGSGSGLCALVAVRCGAASVDAIDIDPVAEAAVAVNARANGARVGFSRVDAGDLPEATADVILAGDISYEETMAEHVIAWLRLAARNNCRVLIGDPGRRYLPRDLQRLATYRVRTSREIEEAEVKEAAVFTIRPVAGGG
jgi:predicted nicotinamide N-methyase